MSHNSDMNSGNRISVDNETLHLALEGAGLAFWDHDFNQNKVVRSPQWAYMLGYDPMEISGQWESWLDLIHPEDMDKVLHCIGEHRLGRTRNHRVEHRLKAADGTWRTVLNWGRIVKRNDDGTPARALGFHVDLTERQKVGQELSRLDKLESLGTLAGGIAHDFNNVLTAAKGNINLAQKKAESHETKVILRQAELALHQATGLTRQLQSFSKGALPPLQVCKVDDAIKEAVGISVYGSKLNVNLDLSDNLWLVEAGDGQLVQMFYNLLINADQAMPEGGRVYVEAANVMVESGEVPPLADGKYVRVRVKDEGPGINGSDRHRVFDPFFTTKTKGTGLGLASVLAIAQHQGGHVTLTTSRDPGAAFLVYLAATQKTTSVVEQPLETPVFVPSLVLVMDDDDLVRSFTARAVRHLGCEVVEAACGSEAVDLFARAYATDKPVSVVLLDLTVRGGVGGLEAMQRIRRIDPDIKVAVVSGYSEDPVMLRYREFGFDAGLGKPFKISDLSRILAALSSSPHQDFASD